MTWNESLPAAVKDAFAELPSKASPRAPAKPTKRLLNLAAEIAIDELRPNPAQEAHHKLFTVLDGQLAQHKAHVSKNVDAILTAEIKPHHSEPTVARGVGVEPAARGRPAHG